MFSTKNRNPLLTNEISYKVFKHIIDNCKEKGIFLQTINGYTEHIHCLISLGKDQRIAKVAQLIKGESSFWIKKEQLAAEEFMWQDDYFAVSISESVVEKVEQYIKNQKQHHSEKTFTNEVGEFMEKYGWQKMND